MVIRFETKRMKVRISVSVHGLQMKITLVKDKSN